MVTRKMMRGEMTSTTRSTTIPKACCWLAATNSFFTMALGGVRVVHIMGKHGHNYLHNPEPEVGEHLPEVLGVVEGGLVVAEGLVGVRVLLLLG